MKNLLIIALIASSCITVYGSQNFSYQQVPVNTSLNQPKQENYMIDSHTLKGSVITVPAGEKLSAVFLAPISSENAYAGQEITLATARDYYYNGKLIAPEGSTITGTVIDVAKAKHGTLNGKMTLRFTHLITPYGLDIPISAVIQTNDNTGTLMGGTKFDSAKEYGKDLAIGAGAGALIGTIAAPLSGGSVGRGAALMTAVGAGGGLVKSIWDKGNDVEIPANALIDLVLTQPITVNPASLENQ
jgi:hypothetical protein